MSITDIFDQQTMDAILADAKDSGISAKDVQAVLDTLTDKTKAPSRSANTPGELVSLLGDDKDAVAADIADATGVDRVKTGTILMLAAPFLLKYLFSNNSSGTNSSAGSLLGSLLGGGAQQQQTQSNDLGALLSLMGGQTQQSSQASLLSSLLGGQVQSSNTATTSLLGSLLGGASQQNTASQANGLGALMDLMGGSAAQQTQQTSNQNSGNGLLGALFNLLGDNN